MPPDSVMTSGILLVPQRKLLEQLLDMGRILRLAEQAAGVAGRRQNRFERRDGELLRHQADPRPRLSVVADDVVAVGGDLALARRDDAADDRDQRRLAGAVRPEQREDLAAADIEIDVRQRLEAGRIGLRQVRDGDDRLHGNPGPRRLLDTRPVRRVGVMWCRWRKGQVQQHSLFRQPLRKLMIHKGKPARPRTRRLPFAD